MSFARHMPRWPGSVVIGCSILCFAIGFFVRRSNGRTAAPAVSTAAPATAVSVPARLSWAERWREKAAQPTCPSTTRKRAELIEELARADPKRALELARAESNLLVQDELRAGALRGWAAVAPDAAMSWAMAQPVLGERMRCFEAVLTGAVEHPAEAVRLALKACASDPEPAAAYGQTLVNALIDRAGDFEAAAEFARQATMVEGQSHLVDSAYFQWAQNDPKRALMAVATLTDRDIRDAALEGMVQGCASADAHAIADYAKTLPEGEERSRIMAIALPQWIAKDPVAALEWINQADPDPDFDRGLIALTTRPSMALSQPLVALDLADSICDSGHRRLAKNEIFMQWARNDYNAAVRYAQSVQNPEYREMFMGLLENVALHKNE